jgi:hypothetical protein
MRWRFGPAYKIHGEAPMLYDNIYILGELFHHFILDNPDLQEDGWAADADANLQQRLAEWLECETSVTDLSHKATLLQLASAYEAMLEMRDTMTTSTGL